MKPYYIALIVIAGLAVLLVIFGLIKLQQIRKISAKNRALARKSDEELLGKRSEILRKNKKSVPVNLYMPDNTEGKKLPVIFNIHGGGFVGGDADELDSQCAKLSKAWGCIFVSVNYTTADVKPIGYSVKEITDVIYYFRDNAEQFNADISKFTVMGHSSGANLAARTAIKLQREGFKLSSQILCCPWTGGLPKKVNSEVAPALFVLGGADPISQRSFGYSKNLKQSGVLVEIAEYEKGLHPFMTSLYPETFKNMTEEEKSQYITGEQKSAALKAETDIMHWLDEIYLKTNKA